MIVTWHYPKTSACLDRFVVEYLTLCSPNDMSKRYKRYKVRSFTILKSGMPTSVYIYNTHNFMFIVFFPFSVFLLS